MTNQIKSNEIRNNPFFWYTYISLFRGYDEKNELNIDEALEVIDINKNELLKWQETFFVHNDSNSTVKFIGGRLNQNITFHIEFQENEIQFFLNDIYIGNLGGHFEAWFLTLKELTKFGEFDLLFLLLLPMSGIEKKQIKPTKTLIIENLKTISIFKKDTEYITECILNGLIMNEGFSIQKEIGIVNNQNHSVRNIEKYPKYKNDIIELNKALEKLIE